MQHHSQDDHHDCIRIGAAVVAGCYCGAAPNDAVHGVPPCEWCDHIDYGAPAPYWHRTWCRFVAWCFAGGIL